MKSHWKFLAVLSLIAISLMAVEKYQATPGKFRCTAVAVATASPTTVVSGASEHNAWVIQNLGPNAIYCNGDPAVTVSTTNSLEVAANGGVLTSDMLGGNVGGHDTIKCIAATALQSSPLDTRKCEVW